MKKLGGLLVAALMVLFGVPAFGDAVIDFGTGSGGTGGTITIGAGTVVGVNIPIGSLTVAGAPIGNNTPGNPSYVVTGTCGLGLNVGCLNFSTIANTVSVVGAVPGLGLGSLTLLSGSFAPGGWTWDAAHNSFSGFGPDIKDAALLGALGMTTPPWSFNFFGFSLAAGTPNPSAPAISTDFRNTGVVPEPMTGVLFGLGLVAVGTYLRRRKA